MQPSNLLCEYSNNPIDVNRESPVLSWSIQEIDTKNKQSAYRVLVASKKELLGEETADIWDSGEVESGDCCCSYQRQKALLSTQAYCWKVKVKCGNCWSEYSDIATFETALLDSTLWEGQWIGMPNDSRAVGMFRMDKRLDCKIKRARIYLASDGYVQLWINGNKVGKDCLDPANVDHRKHVFYRTYDITSFLQEGDNAIGVMMGHGWATHPRFLLQGYIWLENGLKISVKSNFQDWIFLISPILSATIYSGEIYNANYERPEWNLPGDAFYKRYQKQRWNFFSDNLPIKESDNEGQYQEFGHAYYDVMELPAPDGILIGQMVEPIREIEYLKPVSVMRLSKGGFVFDFGQNFAGVIRIRLSGKQYTPVKIQYSEILNDDHTLNMEYLRVSDPTYPFPMQCDQYILKGADEEIYQPMFTYHGFRYVSVEGVIDALTVEDVTGIVLHSDVEQTGTFECSNELVNKIHSNILWTERSNLYSIPTDCCQRSERQGWLNDLTARAEASVFNFNLNRFYEKFMQDIADTQDPVSGAIADTAPFRRGNRPADPVSSSFLILGDLLYTHYGNIRPIREHYDSMKQWTDFLGRISRNGVIAFSMYGDWASPIHNCFHNDMYSPMSAITPGDFVSTGYYYLDLLLMEKFAGLLEKNEDQKRFSLEKEQVKQALLNRYRDPQTLGYAGGSQGANVFALYLDIVPKEEIQTVVELIVKDIEENGNHLTTGNLMTKYLPEILTEYGHVDAAFRLITQTTYPSWGYMIEQGATTIWERWEYETGYGMNSHNHPMYGSISAWFYRYLSGITPMKPNFSKIKIKPYIPQELRYVKGSVKTYAGKVVSNWEKTDDGVRFDICIPNGTEAEIYLPVQNDQTAIVQEGQNSFQPIRSEDGYVGFSVMGGKYCFYVK